MYADVPNHEPSFMLMNCGDGRQARPSMGSWVTYGLGTDNQNLPGFIAMCPGGQPTVGAPSAGGRGKIFGTFIGALIIGVLSNGLVLMNVPYFTQLIIKGIVIILAVAIDSVRKLANSS